MKGEEWGEARRKRVLSFERQLHLLGQLPWKPGAEIVKQQDDDKEPSQSDREETRGDVHCCAHLESLYGGGAEERGLGVPGQPGLGGSCCLETNKQINQRWEEIQGGLH